VSEARFDVEPRAVSDPLPYVLHALFTLSRGAGNGMEEAQAATLSARPAPLVEYAQGLGFTQRGVFLSRTM